MLGLAADAVQDQVYTIGEVTSDCLAEIVPAVVDRVGGAVVDDEAEVR